MRKDRGSPLAVTKFQAGWLAGWNYMEGPLVGLHWMSFMADCTVAHVVSEVQNLNLSIHASMDTVCFSTRRNASESRKRAQRQQHERYRLMKGSWEQCTPTSRRQRME